MSEELLKKWAVVVSIFLIILGFIGIIKMSINGESQQAPSLSSVAKTDSSARGVSDTMDKLSFALLSLGGGGLFSQLILIEARRKRREYIYRSIIRCLCRISISMLIVIIENGIISIRDNGDPRESIIMMIIREFEDHLVEVGYALPASGCLIDIIQNKLEPAIYNGDFELGAFKRFLETSNSDIQYLIARLLPEAYEISDDAEMKKLFETTESKCNLFISKLSQEDWDIHSLPAFDTQNHNRWTDYRSYILNESDPLSEIQAIPEDILNANVDELLAIGRSYVALKAIKLFSLTSAFIVETISECLTLKPIEICQGTAIA